MDCSHIYIEEIYRLLVEQITWSYGDNDVFDKILDGNITHATLGLTHNDVDEELDTLLESV